MKKGILLSQSEKAPEGQIHFIASKDFTDVNFFQRLNYDTFDFSNLDVYINNELTNQVANSISANANDDIIIKATRGKYPIFGYYRSSIDYIKSIEEPLPLLYNVTSNGAYRIESRFDELFYNCSSLTNILEDLFINNPQAITFESCFRNCSNLTSIPENIFSNNTNIASFNYCFKDCSSLNSIPSNLFANNIEVTEFCSCFENCSSLTSIPSSLFANNNKVDNFYSCFSDCTNLTEIPENLFKNNTKATGFRFCFYGCTNLSNIPRALFSNNAQAKSFQRCFQDTAISNVPEGLFDNCIQATEFDRCFYSCANLTNIPIGLFNYNIAANDFQECFRHCTNLTVNVQIGSTASSIEVRYFANNTKEKGTVYCKAGSAAYTAFSENGGANVNVLTY